MGPCPWFLLVGSFMEVLHSAFYCPFCYYRFCFILARLCFGHYNWCMSSTIQMPMLCIPCIDGMPVSICRQRWRTGCANFWRTGRPTVTDYHKKSQKHSCLTFSISRYTWCYLWPVGIIIHTNKDESKNPTTHYISEGSENWPGAMVAVTADWNTEHCIEANLE